MTNQEVLSAFIDNEPFDARELADALADPDGRQLLIDLVALRGVVQPEPAIIAAPSRARTMLRIAVIAAGLTIAAGAGYQFGARIGAGSPTPPEPTRVIVSDTQWRDAQ